MTNDTSVLHIHARDNDCYQHSTIASVWCSSKTSSRFLRPYVVSFLTCTHISPPLHQLPLQLHHHQLSWTCNHRYVCTMFDYCIILFIIIVDGCWWPVCGIMSVMVLSSGPGSDHHSLQDNHRIHCPGSTGSVSSHHLPPDPMINNTDINACFQTQFYARWRASKNLSSMKSFCL